MELALEITGVEELTRELRALPQEVKDKIMPLALKAGAAIVRDQAQANAPVGKTGALATSITVSMRGGVVLVGPSTEPRSDAGDKRNMRNSTIGLFQEKGTVNHFAGWTNRRITASQARRQRRKQIITIGSTTLRMPKHDFLRPALEESSKEAFQAEADKLRALIEAKYREKGT